MKLGDEVSDEVKTVDYSVFERDVVDER